MVCFEFRITQSHTDFLECFLLVLTNFKQSMMFFSQIGIVLYQQNCILFFKLLVNPNRLFKKNQFTLRRSPDSSTCCCSSAIAVRSLTIESWSDWRHSRSNRRSSSSVRHLDCSSIFSSIDRLVFSSVLLLAVVKSSTLSIFQRKNDYIRFCDDLAIFLTVVWHFECVSASHWCPSPTC